MSKTKDINEDYLQITLSNNDTLRDKIHDIHNFLRNSGIGYGLSSLKIFNLFYALKKLELNNHFEKTGLSECCRFSNMLKGLQSKGLENVLNEIKKNDRLSYILSYSISKSINSVILNQLINLIEELCEIENKLNVQLSGKIYEYFIGRDQTAISELGAYFTDRHIINYIYEELLPNEDENIYDMIDMFGGSGGFTVGYINYLYKNFKNINWKEELKKISHYDMNEDIIKTAMLEVYCLTGDFPPIDNIKCINSFNYDFSKKKYHYILTNPPYGGDKNKKSEIVQNLEIIKNMIEKDICTKFNLKNIKKIFKLNINLSESDKNTIIQYKNIIQKLNQIDLDNNKKNVNLDTCHQIYRNFAKKYGLSANDKESISLIMMMVLLKEGGTAIGVLKEGVFFDSKYSRIRKCLINNFNVKKVISIPKDQFENTKTKTSIIVFSNTKEKTSCIEFYNLIIKKDDKTNVFKNKNGIYSIVSIKDRISDVYHESITCCNLDEIIYKKYSLNSKDYVKNKIKCNKSYEMVKLSNLVKYLPATKHYTNIGKNNGKYRFYNSSQDNKLFVDFCEVKEYSIILGQGGNFNIHFDINFTASKHVCVLQSLNNDIIKLKYLYYIIPCLKDSLISNGTGINWLNRKNIKTIEVPIPKCNDNLKYWVNKLSKLNDDKISILQKVKENELKIQYLIDEINKNDNNNVFFDKSLVHVKKFNKYKASDGYLEGKFAFYTSSQDKILFRDDYEFENNHIIIGRGGLSSIHLDKQFSVSHDDVFVLKVNDKYNIKYIYNYLKYNKNLLNDNFKGSNISHISKETLSKIIIKIPNNESKMDMCINIYEEIENLKSKVFSLDQNYKLNIKELYNDAISI